MYKQNNKSNNLLAKCNMFALPSGTHDCDQKCQSFNKKQIEKRMIYYHLKKFSKCFAKLFLTKCLPFLSRIQNHSKKITQNESKIIKIEQPIVKRM